VGGQFADLGIEFVNLLVVRGLFGGLVKFGLPRKQARQADQGLIAPAGQEIAMEAVFGRDLVEGFSSFSTSRTSWALKAAVYCLRIVRDAPSMNNYFCLNSGVHHTATAAKRRILSSSGSVPPAGKAGSCESAERSSVAGVGVTQPHRDTTLVRVALV